MGWSIRAERPDYSCATFDVLVDSGKASPEMEHCPQAMLGMCNGLNCKLLGPSGRGGSPVETREDKEQVKAIKSWESTKKGGWN